MQENRVNRFPGVGHFYVTGFHRTRKYERRLGEITTRTKEAIMAIRVGINGFGRIGRNVFRASLNEPGT